MHNPFARLIAALRDRYRTWRFGPLMRIDDPPALAMPLPPSRGIGVFHVAGPNGELPDVRATPGAINPAVTDATITDTIGSPGWTTTVRPSVAYTNTLKRKHLAEYGLTGNPFDFEEDHLVPLCCGGHPTDERNLWPQRRNGINGAPVKDLTEVLAQHAILAGHISLAEVQQGFMEDWTALHDRLTRNAAVMRLAMAMAPPEAEP